jgi:hypothetical protein
MTLKVISLEGALTTIVWLFPDKIVIVANALWSNRILIKKNREVKRMIKTPIVKKNIAFLR